MNTIIENIDKLITESNIKTILASGGILAIAGLFGFILNPTFGLAIYLANTLLSYLLFSIIIGSGVIYGASKYSQIKNIIDIDDFLKDNFKRLRAYGYSDIDNIQNQAIKARNNVISECENKPTSNMGYYILKAECAKKGIITYLETSDIHLFSYYMSLLMKKGISLQKSQSIDNILSSKEELPFVIILSKIHYKYIEILEFINYDISKFNIIVLEESKKNVNFTRNIQSDQQSQKQKKFIPNFRR
jgi:hypothetical protein